MKILVACEYSGIVREAFKAKGFDAWSCDLLPTDIEGQHYQGDVVDVLRKDWDCIIAFPPCTHLAVSGSKYFAQKQADGRQQGVDFFMLFANHPAQYIAIENPVGIMSSKFRKPDQIIQPYHFGHDASKKTCLWLKNLPKLNPTGFIEPRIVDDKKRWGNQTDDGQNKLIIDGKWIGFNDPRTAHERSKTYRGIAAAMAEQWGNYLLESNNKVN